VYTDRCGNTRRQKCRAEGRSEIEVKIQEFMHRDTTNVELEMYDCTSNSWSHWYVGWNFIPPYIPDSHPQRVTNTKCPVGTVLSPDDGHIVARNL